MSTVLWANSLHAGRVNSDHSDKPALYRHSNRLDQLSRELGISSFLAAQDFTDLQFNLGDEVLPPDAATADELMAQSGTWIAAQDAIVMCSELIDHIRERKIEFGIFESEREQVLRELEESLKVARQASAVDGRFNFSVVSGRQPRPET